MQQEFTTTVEAGERGRVFITLPFNPVDAWGKRPRHYVTGTLNGQPYQGALGVRAGVHFMPLNKELQGRLGLRVGDRVNVVMQPGEASQDEPPADVAAALERSPSAKAFFASLTAFQRNTHLGWITGAKRAETRSARIAETIEALVAGRKQR